MKRRDGELRRRLTTVNYYNTASQMYVSDANPGKSNQWVQDIRNGLFSIEGTGESGLRVILLNPVKMKLDLL